MTKKSVVPFNGTKEQEAKLYEVLASLKDVRGAVMPALQQAQEIYGYLPIEVQQMIADYLNVPLAEVYGIATFYAQFSLTPSGKYKIGVCLGTACYVKGSGEVYEKIQKFSAWKGLVFRMTANSLWKQPVASVVAAWLPF